MTYEPMTTHGALSWFELATTDVPGAKKFYADLFGWSLEDMQVDGMTYTIIKAAGQEIGGMKKTPPEAAGAPPCWGVYITVKDVDLTASRVAELGGKIVVPPMDIPEVGRFCLFQDPQGAYISAITYLKKA